MRALRPFLLCAAAALAGCSGTSVRIPNADRTPPLAALDVIGSERTLVLMVGDDPQTVDLERDDSLVLIALGEDGDGGIKDLSLVGNATVTCSEPRADGSASRSTGFRRSTVSGSAPRSRAPRRKVHRFVLRAGDFAALCPGRLIAAVVGQATVRTVNFHGGQAVSPRLEFRLADPEEASDSAQGSISSKSGDPVCPSPASAVSAAQPSAPASASGATSVSGTEETLPSRQACAEKAQPAGPQSAIPSSRMISPRSKRKKSPAPARVVSKTASASAPASAHPRPRI